MTGPARWPKLTLAAQLYASAMLVLGVTCNGPQQPPMPPGPMQEVADAYGIEVVATDPGFPIQSGETVIDARVVVGPVLREYLRLLAFEVALYPAEVARRTSIDRVVLGDRLTIDGLLRGGCADTRHSTIYLNIASEMVGDPSCRPNAVHHEIFHCIDASGYGYRLKNQQWAALNEPGFRYVDREMGTTGRTPERIPAGFVSAYSTTGPLEDKAEIFAHLMTDPQSVEFQARFDRVLANKVDRLKAMLVDLFPEMDDAFWQKLATLKRPGRPGKTNK